MKRKNVIILVLAVLLLISLLTACGSNVSFKIDFIVDGAVIHTIDTKGNEEIQVPADPEKEGYIFDGWYWDKDTWEKPFTANSLLNAPLSENMSVYAKWKTEGENEVQTYTITFNSNGGGDVSAITKEAGESITAPTAPTKTGYTFGGWYTDNGTFENAFEFDVMPAESLILYAKWIGESDYTPGLFFSEIDGGYGVSKGTATAENIVIPAEYNGKSVTSIGDYAFYGCSSLTSITIPDSVISIGNSAFYACSSLTSITIPDSVISIGNSAFYVCSSLTSITIPDSVTSIGEDAFSGCSSLTSITIPKSVTSIGDGAFSYCSSLTSIEVSVDNINYKSIEGVLFNKAVTELIQYPIGNSKTSYDIPISVTSIGAWAFSSCSSLTSITIPDSVTSIGDRAFSSCSSLTSITIPDSVTSIGAWAFYDCTSLTIYAEASSKPNGWHDPWKPDNRPVVWGYAGQAIDFDSNGGGDVSAITKEAGVSITAPTAPTRTGYTFGGWYTDNNTFRNEYEFTTMPEESFTLYAKWIWDGQNDFDTNGYYLVDNYIWFGEYPQTIKANEVTVGTSADTRGYYLGSDGYYYAKVTATPSSTFTFNNIYKFSTSATVTRGTVYYFKVEPIKWRILTESGGTALILCESIIANKRYAAYSNNYMNSEIRAWLNDEFYNTAFNTLQQELIQITNVDNSAYSTGYSSNSYACANTNDKIFLPSYREMVNTAYGFSSDYYAYDTARRRLTSDYSRATGAYMNTNTSYYGNGYWWLRSPDTYYGLGARSVDYDGDVYYYSGVYGADYGVVPALVIDLR